MPFLQYLVDNNILTKYHIDDILANMAKGESLDQAFVRLRLDSGRLRSARSVFYGIPEGIVPENGIPKSILTKISEAAARTYKIIPIEKTDTDTLRIGIVDPGNTEALNAIQFMFSNEIASHELCVISYSDFERSIDSYSRASLETTDSDGGDTRKEQNNQTKMEDGLDLEGKDELNFQAVASEDEKEGGPVITVDAPAVKAFNVIVQDALDAKASDIHIEPGDTELRVRFRLDGDLATKITLPKQIHPAIVARVKILTKTMKLDEKRKPQDGRFYAMVQGRKVDFRVSTMPTFFGEKIVIRILDQGAGTKGIEKLGLLPDHLDMMQRCISIPFGMVLVTGPTGSGKSTTLYSMLSAVDKEKKNVVSLEDPVEYNMKGVNQSQVQAEIGYTFANGLRSILRQDPDVIMVGEIRDKETAQLAIQAALTGHLVFSTLHTNTAIGAIARLVDMGVDPYLIPPVVKLIIAQRLVHRINPNIPAVAVPIDGSVRQILDHEFADLPAEYRAQIKMGGMFYDANPEIKGSMTGRVAVFEMLEMNRELEALILKDPSEPTIYKWAREHGMRNIREDAMIKSSHGIVPWSEVHDL